MSNSVLKECISETLDILEHMDKIYMDKIDIDFRNFLYENKSENYISHLDHSKQIIEMDLMENTKSLLLMIYIMYWSSEEERAEFIALLKENEKKSQNDINDNLNYENLFSNKNKIKNTTTENLLPVEKKEKSILERIIDFIKKLFHF